MKPFSRWCRAEAKGFLQAFDLIQRAELRL
jgi:hypothetical protein